jgi:hypothetical protein
MGLRANIFYSHSVKERLLIVKQDGEFIARIKYYGFYIDLYLLDQTFVEVYCNLHNGKVEDVEIIEADEERLALFAAGVNLSDLFKNN